MFYLILIMAVLGTFDIIQMKAKKQKKEIAVYVAFMLLVGLFGIIYYANQDRASFTKLLFSLLGRKV